MATPRRHRLGTRLYALAIALVSIAIVLPTWLLVEETRRALRAELQRSALDNASVVALAASEALAGEDVDQLHAFVAKLTHTDGAVTRALFTDGDGRVIAHSRPDRVGTRILFLSPPPAAPGVTVEHDPQHGEQLVVTVPVLVSGEPFGAFQAATSLAALETVPDAAAERAAGLGAALLVIGLVAARWLARSIAGPVTRLAEAAEAFAAGRRAEPAAMKRKDEIGSLARSFDAMTAQIATQHEELRRHSEQLEQRVVERTAELHRARDAALEAVRLKSEFLANMSHEIRTPLNGVLGFVELLAATPLDARQHDYLATVRSSGESLLTILNDILDFSKIEAGRLELEEIEHSPRDAVEGVAGLLAAKAQSKGLALVVRVDADVPERVVGDPTRLRQIVTNLAGNAIKFTERGQVSIEAEVRAVPGGAPLLAIAVSDTGVGIDAAAKARLFRPFIQADGSTTRRFGGTGLGLVISRRLAERMGGRLELESDLGRGSRFTLEVPLRACRGLALEPVLSPGTPVLVAIANADERRAAAELLRAAGGSVECVADAVAARAAVDAARAPFRVALADGACVEVLAFPRLAEAHRLRLAPLSEAAALEPAAVGVQVVLAAPLRRAPLRDALQSVLVDGSSSRGRPALPTSAASPSGAPDTAVRAAGVAPLAGCAAGRRLLLAEDHPVNQKLALALLSRTGAEVAVAADGEAAIEAWTRGAFDLILMDVQMPRLDGPGATAKIRSLEASRSHIPIVALTANAMIGDRERYLAAGMDDYLSKPIRPPELARVLRRFFGPTAAVTSPPCQPDGGSHDLPR